jgi:hypothetical protein
MSQVLGVVLLDVPKEKECEDGEVNDSAGHADLMCHECSPPWLIEEVHEDREVES